MKATKTLLFMLWSPMSFIAYTLACGILFSALITISDDLFVHGVLPDAAEAANRAFADLPGSLWKLVTAFSLITEEVVRDFHFHYGVFIIDPAIYGTPSDVSYRSFGLLVSRLYFQIWRFSLFDADPFGDYTCFHLQLSRSKRHSKRCCKRRRGMDAMVSTANWCESARLHARRGATRPKRGLNIPDKKRHNNAPDEFLVRLFC